MTINKQNLSTSADGADIFTIDGSSSPFTNFGNLSTSGQLASAIYGAADGISIFNKGTISTTGDGSPGIEVGQYLGVHFDNVSVANYGRIATSGAAVNDAINSEFSDGIDLYGNNDRATNFGSISVANNDADNNVIGMYSVGVGNLLLNYGSIESTGSGMQADGFDGTETGSVVRNFGQIHVTGDDRDGIELTVPDSVAENYGSITIDGVVSYGMALSADGDHGANYGTIVTTGEADRGVIIGAEGGDFGNTTLDNYGTIKTTGLDSVGARFSGNDDPGVDGGTITNYGKIVSAGWSVKGADANDHFVNHGSLVGDADMGAGDDSFVAGKGGSLAGELTLGEGNDLIVFEKGGGKLVVSDFVAGAGTDDVIDVSAFGFHSFAEVMAHASQSGADVVLKLGAKDQIVLENVTLASLNADDFTLGASGAHATGLVHHDLFGMA